MHRAHRNSAAHRTSDELSWPRAHFASRGACREILWVQLDHSKDKATAVVIGCDNASGPVIAAIEVVAMHEGCGCDKSCGNARGLWLRGCEESWNSSDLRNYFPSLTACSASSTNPGGATVQTSSSRWRNEQAPSSPAALAPRVGASASIRNFLWLGQLSCGVTPQNYTSIPGSC